MTKRTLGGIALSVLYAAPLVVWLQPPWYVAFSIAGLVNCLVFSVLDQKS